MAHTRVGGTKASVRERWVGVTIIADYFEHPKLVEKGSAAEILSQVQTPTQAASSSLWRSARFSPRKESIAGQSSSSFALSESGISSSTAPSAGSFSSMNSKTSCGADEVHTGAKDS